MNTKCNEGHGHAYIIRSGSSSSSGRGHSYFRCGNCDKEIHFETAFDSVDKLAEEISEHVSRKGKWERGDRLIFNHEDYLQITITRK